MRSTMNVKCRRRRPRCRATPLYVQLRSEMDFGCHIHIHIHIHTLLYADRIRFSFHYMSRVEHVGKDIELDGMLYILFE